MAKVLGLQCVRCAATYPADHYAADCPACRTTARSNLTVVYDETLRVRRNKPAVNAARGLWRYGDVLPVDVSKAVSLGEGDSPLHHLTRIGADLGLAGLHVKDETRNPTWSFKDRLACMAVSSAKNMGARAIVSSSSGNAGAAAAAYAAKAGLPCTIFTFKGTSETMLTQMQAYGATVVEVSEKADRWTLMQYAVDQFGWFPTSPFFGPVVGSNPYGIEGYKTLAYEIAEQMNWTVPDWCVLPVCYGDALLGMWRGFEDMMAFGWTDRMPRMVSAEVYGSLRAALADGSDVPPDMPKSHTTVAVSIGATQGTVQALQIVRRSGGTSVIAANDDMMRWQGILAQKEGLYVEPSSAAGLVAVEHLRATDVIKPQDSVVCLLTAAGLKDPAATARCVPQPTLVAANIDDAIATLTAQNIFPKSSAMGRISKSGSTS